MSKNETTSDSKTSDYRIDFSDIRGVGPATIEKLEKEGITAVRELHLCRNRGDPTPRNLEDRGVGRDTLEHIAAVGQAVRYTGGDRVKVKHLTGDIVGDKRDYQFVDITTQTNESPDETDESPEIPDYTTDDLQTALDRIHDEYGEGYGQQIEFEADLGRFLSESDTFDGGDHKLPTGIVQSVMRYRHAADRVESQGDWKSEYGSLLVSFSETL